MAGWLKVSYPGCSMISLQLDVWMILAAWLSWLLPHRIPMIVGICWTMLLMILGRKQKPSKILEPCPHDFPLFLKNSLWRFHHVEWVKCSTTRGIPIITNPCFFWGFFPGDFARSCCRVCRRWKYRTVMRCGELGSRLGLSNAKFGDRM